MLHIICMGCGTMGFALAGTDPDSVITCPPGSGCCQLDHSHSQPCPGGHGECTLAKCGVFTPEGEACPGGHCGLGIDGCTGCRVLKITLTPGSVSMGLARPA